MSKFLCTTFITLLIILVHSTGVESQNETATQALDWSPNSDALLLGNNVGDIDIWDVESQILISTLRGHTQEIMTLKWSPDGTHIASGSPDGTVRIWDAASGTETNIIQFSQPDSPLRAILDIDWSPDSRLVAGARETGRIIVWDARTGEQRASYSHDGMARTVAWHPSANLLASGGIDGKVWIWNADNGSLSEFTAISSAGFEAIDSISWSATGEKIAIALRRGGVQVFDFLTQSAVLQIPQPPSSIVSISWSPDNINLAIGDHETVTVVNMSTGLVTDTLSGSGGLDSLAWSPYGGRLAFRSITHHLTRTATSLEGAVQIVVPAPSLERLQAIADACNVPAAVEQGLSTSAAAGQLAEFVARVEALPEDTIPPACAADLIAVAEALQSR